MAYFPDLSKYIYGGKLGRPKMVNIGWLDRAHDFETAVPPRWMIEQLWSYCQYSILDRLGFHQCNLPNCPGPARKFSHFQERRLNKQKIEEEYAAERKAFEAKCKPGPELSQFLASLEEVKDDQIRGYSRMIIGVHAKTRERIKLGSAEIRVFGKYGKIYAAPNMLYHYVTAHHYKPPEEFIRALKESPCPPDRTFLDRLRPLTFPLSVVQTYKQILKHKKLHRAALKQKSLKPKL